MDVQTESHTPCPRALIPDTAKEALARWDAGESVFTIEMGGLGPGYEQCIHICVFELIRAFQDRPLPEDEDVLTDAMNRVLWDTPVTKALGLSGAQAGVAKSLAWQFITHGYLATLNKVEKDRHIQVSRTFP